MGYEPDAETKARIVRHAREVNRELNRPVTYQCCNSRCGRTVTTTPGKYWCNRCKATMYQINNKQPCAI